MTREKNKRVEGSIGGKTTVRKSRRRLIHALTVGGAVATTRSLPEHWSKPFFDTVVLPAHAQTSPSPSPSGIWSGETMVSVNMETSVLQSLPVELAHIIERRPRKRTLLDYVVSPASADSDPMSIVRGCCRDNGDVRITATVTITIPESDIPECDDVRIVFVICWEGEFASKDAGESTEVFTDCEPASLGVTIVESGGESDPVVVSISGIDENPFDLELMPDGSCPPCPNCDEFLDFVKKCD